MSLRRRHGLRWLLHLYQIGPDDDKRLPRENCRQSSRPSVDAARAWTFDAIRGLVALSGVAQMSQFVDLLLCCSAHVVRLPKTPAGMAVSIVRAPAGKRLQHRLAAQSVWTAVHDRWLDALPGRPPKHGQSKKHSGRPHAGRKAPAPTESQRHVAHRPWSLLPEAVDLFSSDCDAQALQPQFLDLPCRCGNARDRTKCLNQGNSHRCVARQQDSQNHSKNQHARQVGESVKECVRLCPWVCFCRSGRTPVNPGVHSTTRWMELPVQ